MGSAAAMARGILDRVRDSRWSPLEYVKLNTSHAAGRTDFTTNPIVRIRRSPAGSTIRRLRPETKLSMPRTAIPAKKHHVATERRLFNKLSDPSAQADIAAAKGTNERIVTAC
jgi:hypothetical protein